MSSSSPLLDGRFEYLLALSDLREDSTPGSFEKVLQKTIRALTLQGLIVSREPELEQVTVLKVTSSRGEFESEAEAMGIYKWLKNEQRKELFYKGLRLEYKDVNSLDFFSPATRAQLLWNRLENVLCDDELKALCCVQSRHSTLIHILKKGGYLSSVSPIHSGALRMRVWRNFSSSIFVPEDEVCNYFGSAVGMYFAWMNFSTMWLLFPAMFGFGLWYTCPPELSVVDHPSVPIFSLAIVAWGAAYMAFWERRCSSLAEKWGTSEVEIVVFHFH